MTVVLICLLRGQSYEDLVDKCSVKRKRKYEIGPNGEIINTAQDERNDELENFEQGGSEVETIDNDDNDDIN